MEEAKKHQHEVPPGQEKNDPNKPVVPPGQVKKPEVPPGQEDKPQEKEPAPVMPEDNQ